MKLCSLRCKVHPSYIIRRALSQVSCSVRTFQLALYVFDGVWDIPVAAAGHPGKVDQAMFGPPFYSPPSLEVISVDPKKGCSVTLLSAEEGCCSIPITQRPSDQSRLHAEHELLTSSSIWSLSPSSMAPSPKGFEHKIIL